MNEIETLLPPRHEPTAGSPGLVVHCAGGLVAGLAIVLAVAAWIARQHDVLAARANAGDQFSFTHGSLERTSIARDWAAQDAAVRDHLETYGWNDRARGIVRIPIDSAIELLSREATEPPRKELR